MWVQGLFPLRGRVLDFQDRRGWNRFGFRFHLASIYIYYGDNVGGNSFC
eukprot:COSAG02_NODE_505_length_20935_cov_38.509119_22_plen_49_part_00